MEKILVATDFTEHAGHAVSSAASIAKQTNSQLILLHVINRPLDSEDDSYENYHNSPGGSNIVVSNIQNRLESIIEQYSIKEKKVIYELRYDVFKTILRCADELQVDLIVMGAYGNSRSDGAFIGSNTERVMLQAKVPVLIIKEELESFNIENTVLASEFYKKVYRVFPKMKNIIDILGTNIHLLKVNTPSRFQRTDESMKLMTEFIKEFSLANVTKNIYNELSIEDGIINFTKSIDADLIAIVPNIHWRLAHIFNKTGTDKLMKKSIRAVLSMRY